MAHANKRTILADCDSRRPRVQKVFRINQSPGITSVVLDDATLPAATRPIPSLADSLVAVPAGPLPPHPTSFISSQGFRTASTNVEDTAHIAIFGCPPVLPVADTLALADHADGAVLVVERTRPREGTSRWRWKASSRQGPQ